MNVINVITVIVIKGYTVMYVKYLYILKVYHGVASCASTSQALVCFNESCPNAVEDNMKFSSKITIHTRTWPTHNITDLLSVGFRKKIKRAL